MQVHKKLLALISPLVVAGFASASAAAAPIYIDFSESTGATGGWNYFNVNATNNGGANASIASLVDSEDVGTGITATITQRFNTRNGNGTTTPTGSAAEFAGHTANSGVGNSKAAFEGRTIVSSQVTFTNLVPTATYDFTFFGSRTNVSDNRETTYSVAGATSAASSLDAANNVSNVATVTGIAPDANGQIVLTVTAGPNNTNGNGFYYLNAMKIVAVPEPGSLGLILAGIGLMAVRRR